MHWEFQILLLRYEVDDCRKKGPAYNKSLLPKTFFFDRNLFVFRMPRPLKPRSIGGHTKENMKEALQQIHRGASMRQASKSLGIPFTTLRRYYLKSKAARDLEIMRLVTNYEVNKVFNDQEEKVLKSYFKHCSSLFYGLTEK